MINSSVTYCFTSLEEVGGMEHWMCWSALRWERSVLASRKERGEPQTQRPVSFPWGWLREWLPPCLSVSSTPLEQTLLLSLQAVKDLCTSSLRLIKCFHGKAYVGPESKKIHLIKINSGYSTLFEMWFLYVVQRKRPGFVSSLWFDEAQKIIGNFTAKTAKEVAVSLET